MSPIGTPGLARIAFLLSKLRFLAGVLQNAGGMAPTSPASVLANHLLGPLTRPWVVVSGGLAGTGFVWTEPLSHGVRLAWRLLSLLLSL